MLMYVHIERLLYTQNATVSCHMPALTLYLDPIVGVIGDAHGVCFMGTVVAPRRLSFSLLDQ